MNELMTNIRKWIAMKVDALAADSTRIGRNADKFTDTLYTMLEGYIGDIDILLPFITDKNGNIEVHNLKDELLDIFENMPKREYTFKGLKINTDKSSVIIEIPDTFVWNLLVGDLRKIKFGTQDVEDFINLFNKEV
jgi:hypothetical protein